MDFSDPQAVLAALAEADDLAVTGSPRWSSWRTACRSRSWSRARRGGQDRAGKALAASSGPRLDPAPVLRGPRRGQGSLRVELQEAVASHPGRPSHEWEVIEEDIFSEDFLLTRPLLGAIRSPEPVVLLIDEVDRVEVETEALAAGGPLPTSRCRSPSWGPSRPPPAPIVVLTSNNTRSCRGPQAALPVPPPRPSGTRSEEQRSSCPAFPVSHRTLPRRSPASCGQFEISTSRSAPRSPSRSTGRGPSRTVGRARRRGGSAGTLHVLLKYQSDIEKTAKELELTAG